MCRTFPGGDGLGHRSDGLLDRHAGVYAVLVPEIDVVDSESLEAALERAARVCGRAVDADAAHVLVELETPLRRKLNLVAAVADRRADDFLVAQRAVDLGGVDEGDAEVDRAVDRRGTGFLGRRTVGGGDAHAAEAQR